MLRVIWKNASATAHQGLADPAISITALLALAALVALYILWRVVRHRPAGGGMAPGPSPAQGWPATKHRCRWRRDRRRAKRAAMVRWVCAECGVDGYTSDGRPPKLCKRSLRDPGL